jgi:hypothetical protein
VPAAKLGILINKFVIRRPDRLILKKLKEFFMRGPKR